MSPIIGIRREDLDKRGEQRVAISPALAKEIVKAGHPLWIQPALHPETKERKRAFNDTSFQQVGASIKEDLSGADIIFGLKEVNKAHLIPEKVYLFFSHTHKGQIKNRSLLQAMIDKRITLIDYELITDDNQQRALTAFTYMAGYAGMIDSLWTLGKRWQMAGIDTPFVQIPQSIESGDLSDMRSKLRVVGDLIRKQGTPAHLPPVIVTFMGNGRTSKGAQELFDLLPFQTVTLSELPKIFQSGDKHFVYKLVADIPELYRLKTGDQVASRSAHFEQYFEHPELFESNLDQIYPYSTMLMNCILWSPTFPRLISYTQAEQWYTQHQTLQVVGDITCDPEGAIEFSRETWIDDPVFIYHPIKQSFQNGFSGEGIAVMAVTNLPCEFSADASAQFSKELSPFVWELLKANFHASHLSDAHLSPALERATILWKGELTSAFNYMDAYIR